MKIIMLRIMRSDARALASDYKSHARRFVDDTARFSQKNYINRIHERTKKKHSRHGTTTETYERQRRRRKYDADPNSTAHQTKLTAAAAATAAATAAAAAAITSRRVAPVYPSHE